MKRASSLLALLGLAATLCPLEASAQTEYTSAYVGYSCLSETSAKATAQWLSLVPEEPPFVLVDLLFYFYQDCALTSDPLVLNFHYVQTFKLLNETFANLYSYEEQGVTFYFWAQTPLIAV